MYCGISITLSAFVFIILKACLNLREKLGKPYNQPYKISHSYTKLVWAKMCSLVNPENINK